MPKLSKSEIETYQNKGYVIPDYKVPENVLRSLKEALEETLQNYDGCIMTVSHDRWFLDQVCDTIWELPGDGTIVVHPGNYSDYIQRKGKA